MLANQAVSAVIAGPRTFEQWCDYFGALDVTIDAEDEALVDALVAPGHPSSPGYTDPGLSTGTTIKAAHIAELRAAVMAIE